MPACLPACLPPSLSPSFPNFLLFFFSFTDKPQADAYSSSRFGTLRTASPALHHPHSLFISLDIFGIYSFAKCIPSFRSLGSYALSVILEQCAVVVRSTGNQFQPRFCYQLSPWLGASHTPFITCPHCKQTKLFLGCLFNSFLWSLEGFMFTCLLSHLTLPGELSMLCDQIAYYIDLAFVSSTVI
jgi:hypothetical protein